MFNTRRPSLSARRERLSAALTCRNSVDPNCTRAVGYAAMGAFANPFEGAVIGVAAFIDDAWDFVGGSAARSRHHWHIEA